MPRRFTLPFLLCCATCQDPTDTSRTIITRSLHILPDPVPALSIGMPFQLVAVTSGPETGVAWSSRNPDVVRVDGDGEVVGVGIGGSMVTAWLTFDPAIRDSVMVNVGGLSDLLLIVVQIHAITDSTGTPVDSTAVRGPIRVAFVTDIPATILATGLDARLELRDSEVCRIRLISNPVLHNCTVDTGRFGKGPASLVVKIVRTSDHQLLATSPQRTLELVH